ncbi:BQ2448_7389 [Microbotryum intermedium]|uniref:BQ2448_7389 protein n=1 Tax=Microbotryum intermedium TaxID=269621 RepID=A0A238FN80_9BASI|nr:BQ2448_7389 [Microbotryum intermedium]
MTTISQFIPEAFTSEAYESLEAAQAQFKKDLLEFFPEVVPPPVVEPTSQLDSHGRVVFGWDVSGPAQADVDPKAQEEMQAIVGWAIGALRKDQERCDKVRILSLVDYGWFQEKEMQGMVEIVRKSKNLETFAITQGDATHNASYSAYIEPLWEALKQAPLLANLIANNGPIVSYKYDTFSPSLARLELANAQVDDTDGELPQGLKSLTLDYISGFNKAWFNPALFNNLETLRLRDVKAPEIEIITSAIKDFTATATKGPLTRLSLDLFFDWFGSMTPAPELAPAMIQLLAAFSAQLFPQLETLEMLSTPTPSFSAYINDTSKAVFILQPQTIENAIQVVETLSSLGATFPKLETLVLFFGPGDVLVTAQEHEPLLRTMLELLAPIKSLKRLVTNLVPSQAKLDTSASKAYFEGLPSLKHVSFRAKYDNVDDWKAYEKDGKAEGVPFLELIAEEDALVASSPVAGGATTGAPKVTPEPVAEDKTVGRAGDEL